MATLHDEESLLAEYAAEKRMELLPVMIFVGIIITAGVVGNAFTLAYYGFKVKRTPSNIFIASLAVIDLATCVIFSNHIIYLYYYFTFKSVVGCKVYYFINYWLVFSSAFMLVIISVDRYRKLCSPFKRQFTILSSKVVICTTIVISFLFALKGDLIVDVQHVNITNTDNQTFAGYHCFRTTRVDLQNLVTTFYLIDLAIPSMMVGHFVITYGLIIRRIIRLKPQPKLESEISIKRKDGNIDDVTETENDTIDITTDLSMKQTAQSCSRSVAKNKHASRASRQNKKSTNREVKITILMIIITVAFVISYTPYFAIILYVNIILGQPIYELNVGFQIVFRFFVINNAVNPYIFLMFNTAYRQFVRHACKQCLRSKKYGNV